MTLYEGLHERITRNVNQVCEFENGMAASVQTETAERLCIYPVTGDTVPHCPVSGYPLRLGYADMVHKFQGTELQRAVFFGRTARVVLQQVMLPCHGSEGIATTFLQSA